MSALTPAKMKQIFEGVWSDRASILGGRGSLSGEDALAGAAYWRLCEAGREPGDFTEDFEPFLIDILQQYRAEETGSSRRVGSATRKGSAMKFTREHFEQARLVARQWRQEGYDHVVVIRQGERVSRCYPCRQQDLPAKAVGSWDYYRMPTLERLDEHAPDEQSASRAELWIAASIANGCAYAAAPVS